MRAALLAAALLAAAPTIAAADPVSTPVLRDHVFYEPGAGRVANPADITRVVYLNDCKPNGCQVRGGRTDSRTNTSAAAGNGLLAAWKYDDATWNKVVTCMRDVLSPFNLQVTTTDPGTASHFEIMIAGEGSQIGEDPNTLGVSPYACNPNSTSNPTGLYIDNTLVFAFANMSYYATGATTANAEELCATAAQELAHSFALDHVLDSSDPLTYFPYNGRRYYKDHMACGSDCVNGVSPSGLTCTSANGLKQAHACVCGNGNPMQDDVQTMLALFGAGTPVVPAVAFVTPKDGSTAHPGDRVEATVTADAAITAGNLLLDGTSIGSGGSGPFIFNLPTSTPAGMHTLEMDGTDAHGTVGKATVTFTVAAPAVLGAPCTMNSDCASNTCDPSQVCTQTCDTAGNACPSGFDCIAEGSGSACLAVASGGPGGCAAGGGSAGAIVLGLGFAALVFTRRRA